MNVSDFANNPSRYTDSEIEAIFQRDIYISIIKSKAFSRLKNIHFLGAIDYASRSDKVLRKHQNTRFHHSIGVAKLALDYAEHKGFNKDDEVLCVLAALLHDIGHAPFSHSMESVFVDKYDLGHHQATEKILRGEVDHLTSIWKIIEAYDINNFQLLSILSGVGKVKYSDAFDYPINLDTIEGIYRCTQLMQGYESNFSPDEVVKELANVSSKSVEVFDKFWEAKGYVYRELIYSKLGIFADYLCKDYMRNTQEIEEDFFYLSELQFKKKHSKIFTLLNKLRKVKSPDLFIRHNVDYYERIFKINKDQHISNIEDLEGRYTYSKNRKHLVW